MPRISLIKLSATVFWTIVGACVIWFVGMQLLGGTAYALKSTSPSPNGRMIIHEFLSNQEGEEHAPYGQILALSQGTKLTIPGDGYVFFAGYCKGPIKYEWKGNENVSVRCPQEGQDSRPRTLASIMYGVRIDFSDR